MNVKNLFMGDVEPLLMSSIGKIKASKKSLNHYSAVSNSFRFDKIFPLFY